MESRLLRLTNRRAKSVFAAISATAVFEAGGDQSARSQGDTVAFSAIEEKPDALEF